LHFLLNTHIFFFEINKFKFDSISFFSNCKVFVQLTHFLLFTITKKTQGTKPDTNRTKLHTLVNNMPLWSTVTPSNWAYKDPRKGSNGAWNSYIDTAPNSRTTPRAQLAKCVAKFGVSGPSEQNPTSTRRNLDLSVTDTDMITFFKELDRSNCDAAAKHSKSTFNKEYTSEMLHETIDQKTIKDEDKRYEPLLRTKVVVGGDARNQTKIYVVTGTDAEGNDVYEDGTFEDITKYSHVVPIVDFRGLWFASRQFGMTVVVKTLLVWPSPKEKEPQFEGLNIKKRSATTAGGPPSAKKPCTVVEGSHGYTSPTATNDVSVTITREEHGEDDVM